MLRLALLSSVLLFLNSGPSHTIGWGDLARVYDYLPETYSVVEIPQPGTEIRLTITEPGGTTANAIYRKPGRKGPYGCVLLLHGLTSSKETMIRMYGPAFNQAGYAVLAIDAPGHGARQSSSENQLLQEILTQTKLRPNPSGLFDQWREADPDGRYQNFLYDIHRRGVLDYRRALDWLQTRPEIDMTKIAALGTSMGGNMAAILGGVDRRVKVATLCMAGEGNPDRLNDAVGLDRLQRAATYPSLYIGHLGGRPLLMLNGTLDKVFPTEAAQRLFQSASSPKWQEWNVCGHQYPNSVKLRAVQWTIHQLAMPPDPGPEIDGQR